jgi:plasmid stabilization system protein ParE
MPRAEWIPSARADLKEIGHFIAERDGRRLTARKIVREIHAKTFDYASNPLLGEANPNLGEGFRFFPHKRWVVIYQPREYGLEVFAVLDGSREYESIFHSR